MNCCVSELAGYLEGLEQRIRDLENKEKNVCVLNLQIDSRKCTKKMAEEIMGQIRKMSGCGC